MMKSTIKNCIVGALLFTNYICVFADSAHAPGIFGAYITPSFSSSNVNSDESLLPVNAKNSSFEWIGGITYNHIIALDKYFYSVGVSIGNEVFSIENSPVGNEKKRISESHNIMYLYISPIGFTLNTDELGVLDLTAFFSFLTFAKIRLGSTQKTEDGCPKFIKEFNRFGIDLNIRGGLKYALGPNTSLSFGIDWYLGLMNAIASHERLDSMQKAIVTGGNYRVGAYIGIWF